MQKKELEGLRDLTVKELEQKARDAKAELFNLRFALRTGHLTDLARFARCADPTRKSQTIICEKRLAEGEHGAA